MCMHFIKKICMVDGYYFSLICCYEMNRQFSIHILEHPDDHNKMSVPCVSCKYGITTHQSVYTFVYFLSGGEVTSYSQVPN